MYRFDNWDVIVTGGTRGIGAAVSEAFLKSGARVSAVYGGNEAAAETFKEAFKDSKVETRKLDVGDYAAVERFFAEYDETHENLRVLVNCAGIRRDAVVGMMSQTDWQRVIDVNLSGSFNMSKFATQRMSPMRFGRIINITSPSGRMGFSGQSNYAASKAGQVAMTKSLSKEVARRGITVNCVSPGFIATDFIAELDQELTQAYKAQVPMKRFGKPQEVAHAVLFLASETASYITGCVLEVTGGL